MNNNPLTRREFLKSALGALGAAALPPSLDQIPSQTMIAPQEAVQTKAPNVVYIMADQLRACSVGCYGNEEISTPHIDAMASQGAMFINSVSTSPLCGPHRACLMTGRYPSINTVVQNNIKLPPEEICLAEIFGDNGYLTGYIGKWHLNGPTPLPMIDPGWVASADRQGFQRWAAFNYAHVYYGSQYYWNQNATLRQIPEGVYEPDWQTDQAINFINAYKSRQFFLFLSIGTPHEESYGSPGDLPPGGDYVFPYDPASLTLRPNVDYPDPDYSRQEYADYYGITSNFDWNVGRILSALDSLGIANNTIVVVSSDHGDLLGSHYSTYNSFRGKSRGESESLDIPFLLRYPTRISPTIINDVFTTVDTLPTLLGLCRLPIPAGVMGRNFAPLLLSGDPPEQPPWGEVPSTETALVGMWRDRGWAGVRSKAFTLQCRLESLDPWQLFDNLADPYQLTNVVDDPDYQVIKEELYQIFLDWLAYIEP